MNPTSSPEPSPALPRAHSGRFGALPIFVAGQVLIFGLLVLVALLLAKNFHSIARFRSETIDSFDRRTQIQRVLSNLQDAETGERGYVITGNSEFLEPYANALGARTDQVERLKSLLANSSENMASMAWLSRAIDVETNLLARTIGLVQEAQAAAATMIVTSGEGKRDMDAVRVIVAKLLDRDAEALHDSLDAELRSSAFSRTLSYALLLGIFALSILTSVVAFKFHERRQILNLTKQRLVDRMTELEQLGLAERRYRGLLEAAPDAMVVVNQGGDIVLLNAQAETEFGYHRDKLLGKDIRNIIPDGFAQRLIADRLRSAAEGSAPRIDGGVELTGRRKDGSKFPVEIMLSPMDGPQGILVTAAIRNITARKKAESRLRHISEIERMQMEFVSTVSHELRTPLTSIGGSLALIGGGAVGVINPKAGRLVEIAKKNTQRLIRLVNDILDIEKLRSGHLVFQFAPVRIDEAIDQAISEALVYAASFGVGLGRVGDGCAVVVEADAGRLNQCLTNLISNAVKFSPSGGRVEISAKRVETGVRISVADQGPGIPEDFRARIFERFAQADSSDIRQKGGSGLGLSIVREIVQRHGGSVSFVSVVGSGASFHLDLPALEEPPVAKTRFDRALAPTGSAIVDPSYAKAAILHVEDDGDLLEVVREALQDEFRVVSASSLTEARKCLLADTYDLIILDLSLSDGPGKDLIPHLVDATGLPIPIVAFTEEDSTPELRAQVEAVLTKSRVDLVTLVATVRSAITATRRPARETQETTHEAA